MAEDLEDPAQDVGGNRYLPGQRVLQGKHIGRVRDRQQEGRKDGPSQWLKQEVVEDVEEGQGKRNIERESIQDNQNGKLGYPHQERPKDDRHKGDMDGSIPTRGRVSRDDIREWYQGLLWYCP